MLTGPSGTSLHISWMTDFTSPTASRWDQPRTVSRVISGREPPITEKVERDPVEWNARIQALRNAALSVQRGGVGYYPASDFVHVDTGRVRRW